MSSAPLLRRRVFSQAGRHFLPLTQDQEAAVADANRRIAAGEVPFELVDCLCGSSDFVPVAGVDRYGHEQATVVCRRCGLVQSNPRMTAEAYRDFYESDHYRHVYEGVDFTAVAEAKFDDPHARAIFDRVVAAKPREEIATVLEFGAGGGWNLSRFKDEGMHVVGYDYSPGLVEVGRNHGIDLRQGGLEDVDGSYDVIVANHVIEHTLDPRAALRRLGAHLDRGGVFFVGIPDIAQFDVRHLQNAHTYYFTRATLERVASEAGFEVSAHRIEEGGHMSLVLRPTEATPVSLASLEGEFGEIAAIIRRYDQLYPLRRPRAALGRAAAAAVRLLARLRLDAPLRRLLRRG